MIADLAEYYGILDYRGLAPSLIASLVVALRPESRIIRHFNNAKATFDQLLLAQIIDGVNLLIWQNTKNGRKGRNKPKSLYEELTKVEQKEELETFDEADDYLSWRKSKGM